MIPIRKLYDFKSILWKEKNQKSGLLFGDSGTQDFDWYLTGNLDSSFQLQLY